MGNTSSSFTLEELLQNIENPEYIQKEYANLLQKSSSSTTSSIASYYYNKSSKGSLSLSKSGGKKLHSQLIENTTNVEDILELLFPQLASISHQVSVLPFEKKVLLLRAASNLSTLLKHAYPNTTATEQADS